MAALEVSVIVTTFQMPWHLERVLASLAAQTVAERCEIIVTDDGSRDHTADIVRDFSRRHAVPVKFTTHEHCGFHLTRCRNEGARLATAPYLLFLDGDCLAPRDHVEQYLRHRTAGVTHFGYCVRLTKETSERIDLKAIERDQFQRLAPREELNKLQRMHLKALWYQWWGHATKPALKGGNIGMWRADYERLNGFDENFQGWGCEDDDLSYRARAAGLRVRSILGATRTYHLWHPPATTKPIAKWSEGPNVAYLKRRGRLTRCLNGLHKRDLASLAIRVTGSAPESCRQLLEDLKPDQNSNRPCEVELLFHEERSSFQTTAECRVLIAEVGSDIPTKLAKQADFVVAPSPHLLDDLRRCLRDGTSSIAPASLPTPVAA